LVAKSLTTKQALEGMLSGLATAGGGGLQSLFSALPQAAAFATALSAVADAYMKISGAAEDAARAEEKHKLAIEASAEAAKAAQAVYKDEMRRFNEDADAAEHAGPGGTPRTKFDDDLKRARAAEAAAEKAAMAAQRDPIARTWGEAADDAADWTGPMWRGEEGTGTKAARERHNAAVREANHDWVKAAEDVAKLEEQQRRARDPIRPDPRDRPMDGIDQEMRNPEEFKAAQARHERDRREIEEIDKRRAMNEAGDIDDRIMANDNGRQADFRNKFRQGGRAQTLGIADLHNAIQNSANDPAEVQRKQEAADQKEALKKIDESLKNDVNQTLKEISGKLPQALA
jgi:hypothetical protein